MVRAVKGEEFFHIQRELLYSPHSFWSVGQRVVCGSETNPFFGFYEATNRTYPITYSDQRVVEVSAIRLLEGIENGEFNPGPAYKTQAREIAQHFVMLARELIWENVRLSGFSDCPSRQRAIWLIPDEPGLALWTGNLDSPPLQIVRVRASGSAHRCDANLLLGDAELLSRTYDKARRYWEGDLSGPNCEEEILFAGEFEVTEILEQRAAPSS